jgi:hypothetical protein
MVNVLFVIKDVTFFKWLDMKECIFNRKKKQALV